MEEKIRQATRHDWPAILGMIRGDRGLQQDRLPSWRSFTVAEVDGGVVGCCALKVYSEKLAEIRSFAFSSPWARKRYATTLVQECISRARDKGCYQILVTLSSRERKFFRALGFKPFNNQKLAMLRVVRDIEPLAAVDMAGIIFRRATAANRENLESLVKTYPTELLQPGSKLFPPLSSFLLATAGKRVVGCCALVVFPPRQNREPDLAEIRTLVVDPAYKQRGIGQQLVARLVNRAIRSRVWELLAVTKRKNKDWFGKLGFGTRRGSEEAWFMLLD